METWKSRFTPLGVISNTFLLLRQILLPEAYISRPLLKPFRVFVEEPDNQIIRYQWLCWTGRTLDETLEKKPILPSLCFYQGFNEKLLVSFTAGGSLGSWNIVLPCQHVSGMIRSARGEGWLLRHSKSLTSDDIITMGNLWGVYLLLSQNPIRCLFVWGFPSPVKSSHHRPGERKPQTHQWSQLAKDLSGCGQDMEKVCHRKDRRPQTDCSLALLAVRMGVGAWEGRDWQIPSSRF